jgi:hypothetical protein
MDGITVTTQTSASFLNSKVIQDKTWLKDMKFTATLVQDTALVNVEIVLPAVLQEASKPMEHNTMEAGVTVTVDTAAHLATEIVMVIMIATLASIASKEELRQHLGVPLVPVITLG